MSTCKPCPTPCIPNIKLSLSDSIPFEQPHLYRSTVGALQYLSMTRPDISFSGVSLGGYLCRSCWACVDDRKSTSGYCIFLGPNLVAWSSRKQSVVARSSTESEYRSLASATTELMWLKSLLA
ncbi:hypothetical protein DH2020_031318 [Rehmannia glutinosa]|uniref:Mitochondrial protein n=1 Tax=Rehmannia glutinosa TaxID=99300 RepID=A0ABR0VKN3_REHGL